MLKNSCFAKLISGEGFEQNTKPTNVLTNIVADELSGMTIDRTGTQFVV